MDFTAQNRFVTRDEKAAAAAEVRQAYANGLIGDAEFERRMREVERSEDVAQLTAATGLPAVRPTGEPSRLTLAMPHALGAFTSWIGPLLVWLFAHDRPLKREAAKALNFQLLGMVLLIIFGIMDFDWMTGVVRAVFMVLGLVAAVVVAKGRGWTYPQRRMGVRGILKEEE
ncbi:DUF4870 domain-containing protein [Propionicicella superfundia]|uniref:DUF4870 domain-containing protein n=1 Tax=Propionicicella superfundia TaxID=348582 RepID=UPI0004260695|nr:DUF4870 domain-containing protein [Propionicicella superfundia]